MKKTLLYLAAVGLLVGAAWASSPLWLPVLGFTPGGVSAGWSPNLRSPLKLFKLILTLIGSFAAWFQSVVYGANTGGIFSILQSAGALAVPTAVNWIGGALFTAASIGSFFWARKIS
jgi:hypothetical protein